MHEFRLDEVQADAILETRLYQLARLEIEKVREEQRLKQQRAQEIEAQLKSKKARWKLVETELQEVAQKYGDKRRTVLSAGAELVYDAEAYVVHEDATVVVTRDGWMKRLGEIKDPAATRVREGDVAKWILRGNTRDNLALFSNFGVAYVMRVGNVPATTGYGEPVQSTLNFKDGERVIAAALVRGATASGTMPSKRRRRSGRSPAWLVATARGMGFFCRPDLSETTKSGRRFARTKEGDEIVVVAPADGRH